jgi:hypothetical protein
MEQQLVRGLGNACRRHSQQAFDLLARVVLPPDQTCLGKLSILEEQITGRRQLPAKDGPARVEAVVEDPAIRLVGTGQRDGRTSAGGNQPDGRKLAFTVSTASLNMFGPPAKPRPSGV